MGGRAVDRALLPRFEPGTHRLFGLYSRWYLSRSFRAFRLARIERPGRLDGRSIVVFANHASWWDPLVAIALARELFPARKHYAPIDADALEKYAVFKRLGFYAVDRDSRRGAAAFLRTSRAILARPQSAIWITPQGAFRDVRRRPAGFEPGLARIADQCLALPLAIEYVFGEERLPEIWARFGPAVELAPGLSTEERTGELERALEGAQDALAADVIARRRGAYDVLVAGGSGVGGVYDLWRRAKAWARGRAFRPEHVEERL